MSSPYPQAHQRSFNGKPYMIETSQHEHGISIVVLVPGLAPEEENAQTFASEDDALRAGDAIARDLITRLR